MAKWEVSKNRSSIKVKYTNHRTGAEHDCGEQHIDTSTKLIMDWTFEQSDPGDLLILDGQLVGQKFSPAEA